MRRILSGWHYPNDFGRVNAARVTPPRVGRGRALAAFTASTTGAMLLMGAPLVAHASSGYYVTITAQRDRITIPYGAQTPTQRVLIGTDSYYDGVGPVTVNVDLITAAGGTIRLASALPLDGSSGLSSDFPEAEDQDNYAVVTLPAAEITAAGRYIVRTRAIDRAGVADTTGPEARFLVANATPPAVTSVSARPGVATVFPTKDGYRDTMTFSVHGFGVGSGLTASGKAVLVRGKRVVRTWPLTALNTALQWNGRDRGRIVPGRYKLTVLLRGQAGSTRSTATYVTVDARTLVARTLTTSYSPLSVLGDTFQDLSAGHDGDCYDNQLSASGPRVAGAIFCTSRDYLRGSAGDYIALYAPGSVALPAAVKQAQAYGGTSVTVGQHSSVEAGHAYMYLNVTGRHLRERVYDGYYTHKLKWSGNASRLYITFDLGGYARAGVRDYVATWHYRVMR